ncbi:serine protease grass [Drosophila sulfurigaster albostrigata]|uniref:serine protease grass n=1 Tax=Drosophila sulfurigaster albostrigata TaxID=89887 RepID=UPI002D21D9BE|nr:serine protease grass [Drosophila sulfurigaster albostrigata]
MPRRCFLVTFVTLIVACLAGPSLAAYADECNTPNGQPGQCLPFSSCSDIEQQLLAAQKSGERIAPEYASYLQKAACGEIDNVRHFCCANNQIQHNSKVMELFKADDFSCGTILNQRVANGYEVQLSSRPWMALLRYQSLGQSRFLCGGTLISNRYILTAAHCVYGYQDQLYEIRLGEHRISTERDCRQQGRKEKCAPPVNDLGIEKILLHEKYDSKTNINDIALLRLNATVTFQKHIKPICLPITDELKQQAETLSDYFVTGWGTTENGSSSDVLLQASVPIQPRSACSRAYRRDVPDSQLCVGGGDLQDSCKGDSGGPLQAPALYLDMYKLRMVEFGIVSMGVISCGQISLPGLYTNVAQYVQWITDTMARNGL